MLQHHHSIIVPVRKITASIVVILFYIKMVTSLVFEIKGAPIVSLDILIYTFCLASLNLRHLKYDILIVVTMLILAVIVSSARTLALLFLTMYILRDYPLRYIAKLNVICGMSVLLFIYESLNSGVISEDITYQAEQNKVRADFGFGNSNLFALFMFGLCSNLYVLLAYNKNKIITLAVLIPIAIIVSSYSGSRTFLFAIIAMLSLYLIHNRKKETNSRFYRFFLLNLPIVVIAFIFIATIIVSRIPALDLFFSYRFSHYNDLISQTSPIGYLIGNPMIDKLTIDNSYMHMVFRGGLIGFFMFFILYRNTIKYMPAEYRYLQPLLIALLLYGIGESILYFTLIFGNMIFWVIIFQNGINPNKQTTLIKSTVK